MDKRLLYARPTQRLQIGVLLGLLACVAPAPGFAQTPCAACVTVVITPSQSILLPDRLAGLDVLVRVAAGSDAHAQAALEFIRGANGRPGLLIEGLAPLEPATLERAAIVIVRPPAGSADVDAVAFQLKTQLTALRGTARPDARIGIAASPALMTALLRRDIGPYADIFAWFGEPPAGQTAVGTVWRAKDAEIPEAASLAALLDASASGAADRWLWRLPADAVDARQLLDDLAVAAPLLTPGLLPVTHVSVRCGAESVPAFLDPQTLAVVALVARCAPDAPLTVTPPEGTPERITLAGGGTLIRIPSAAPERFAEGVDVTARRKLSAEEIVARHQAAAARQTRMVRSVISSGTLTITFEAPGFPAPVTISSDTIVYTGAGRIDLEQRSIRVNGVAFEGRGVPRLPIIEPERAAAPPLAITLSNLYRYALAGEETVDGVSCYVLSFTPADGKASLFKGRVWISASDFGMVRVAAVQTSLRGPIVSSEQIDTFRLQQPGVGLLQRSEVRQLYEGAGHRTPIQRVLAVARHEINPADFEARRQTAYASGHVLLRDTPEGYRYLRRDSPGGGETAREPVVAARADAVRTLIAGVLVDPNISRPLPFAGLSYVHFNLFGTGTQLNAFFGGTYGQLAFSVPSLGGSRWQLAGRAFGIASSYNDRAFVDGRELYEQNIRQRPAHASVWLLRPLTPRISVRAGYDLDYTHLTRGDTTAAGFVVPADQVVHAARFALEAQRGGWNASVWWNPATRQAWRAWGVPAAGAYDRRHHDFQRYGGSVARSIVVTPDLVARLEGAWMGGRDLDRFSRYSFGTFDNRLRGYPSALIRYDRGFVARSAVAWSPGRLVRLDGFLDSAVVRDLGFGEEYRSYTGVGAGIEAPAPFGMLIAVEWGYGLRGVNSDGSRGTHVVRVSAFKIF